VTFNFQRFEVGTVELVVRGCAQPWLVWGWVWGGTRPPRSVARIDLGALMRYSVFRRVVFCGVAGGGRRNVSGRWCVCGGGLGRGGRFWVGWGGGYVG